MLLCKNKGREEVSMDDRLYPTGARSETRHQNIDAVTQGEREAKLQHCMTQLAHTMLLLSQELAEAAESCDALDLRYVASLIEDTRKASEISKQLIARNMQLC